VTTDRMDALQHTLAGEHAATFVLAALGGRASALPPSPLREALDTAYADHVERRDELRTMITSGGADPVASEAAYRLPAPLDTAAQIAAEALRVESVCVTTYAALVAATSDAVRRWALDALVAAALDQAAFGGTPEALPGL
jgi:Domain of unknown function (DUF4439)